MLKQPLLNSSGHRSVSVWRNPSILQYVLSILKYVSIREYGLYEGVSCSYARVRKLLLNLSTHSFIKKTILAGVNLPCLLLLGYHLCPLL